MKTKVTLLLSFILGLTFQLSAQYELLYENHEQISGNVPRAVTDDGQGNTWMAGEFITSLTLGTITLTNSLTVGLSSQTGYIGKFNSGSNTWLWAKKIERASISANQVNVSAIQDMAVDNGGNVYITGYYQGVVRFDHISLSSTKQGSQYTTDIFVAKYNASGGIVWAKSFGSKAGWDAGYSIALDGSGNIFIGGSFTNKNISCSNGPTDITDVFLAKLNNAGTSLWQKRYASSSLICYGNNAGNELSVDASGNVFLGGQFSGTVSFGNGAALTISSVNNTIDAFAAKINGSGTTQWVKSTGGNANDSGSAIHADASGNVYVGGRVVPDAFLTKYSASGSLVWSVNPYPASPEFASNGIKRINPYEGSILVNDGYVGFKTVSPADGSVMTSDSLVGNASPGPQYFIMDTEIAGPGFVFTVTSKCGEVTIGGTPLTSLDSCPFNGKNFFLVRNSSEGLPAFQADSDINIPLASFQEVAGSEIEIYPNPARDQLQVILPQLEKEVTLFIQNQYGQIVWSEKIESGSRSTNISLDSPRFQSGIYYLVLLTKNEVQTKRLIIEK